VITIVFPFSTFHADMELADAVKALNDGTPIRCWWFDTTGKRREETYQFFSDPSYVMTESESES
jgi:hypothetical protein